MRVLVQGYKERERYIYIYMMYGVKGLRFPKKGAGARKKHIVVRWCMRGSLALEAPA